MRCISRRCHLWAAPAERFLHRFPRQPDAARHRRPHGGGRRWPCPSSRPSNAAILRCSSTPRALKKLGTSVSPPHSRPNRTRRCSITRIGLRNDCRPSRRLESCPALERRFHDGYLVTTFGSGTLNVTLTSSTFRVMVTVQEQGGALGLRPDVGFCACRRRLPTTPSSSPALIPAPAATIKSPYRSHPPTARPACRCGSLAAAICPREHLGRQLAATRAA